MAGETPKSGPSDVKQLETQVAELDAQILATQGKRSVLEAATNAAKLVSLEAQRTEALAKLEKAKEAARQAAEAERAKLEAAKAETLKVNEAAKAAPTTPTTPPAAPPTAPGAPAAATTPTVAPETPAAEAEAEKPDPELGFLARALNNPKVIAFLENLGLGGVAEFLASLGGITIDRAQIQNEALAEGSNAALNETELNKLKELAAKPKLDEFKDTGDPKAETAPWTHVAGWLGLNGKITNQADFFSVVSKGKTKVDLGADKGGQQEVPNFTSFKEAPSGGYKAGDVIIYQSKSGDRIPVVVIDASDPTSPVISFHSTGVLPDNAKFDQEHLEYQIKGTFNDPLVKKALADYTMQSTFRAASLADQQAWYLAKNPPKPKPAAPAGAPATVPGATPGTAPAPAPVPGATPSAPAPGVAPGGPAAAAVPVTAPAGAPVTPPPSVAPVAAAAPAAVKPATAPNVPTTPTVAPAPAKPVTVPPTTPPATGTK